LLVEQLETAFWRWSSIDGSIRLVMMMKDSEKQRIVNQTEMSVTCGATIFKKTRDQIVESQQTNNEGRVYSI
jgi:hypothetical protein